MGIPQAPTPVRWLVVEAGAITDLDFSAARALRDLCDELQRRGIGLIFGRVQPGLRADMDRHGILAAVGPGRTLPTLHEAIALAQGKVSRSDEPGAPVPATPDAPGMGE